MYGEALYKPEMKEGNPIRLYSLDEITEIFCKLGLRICNSFADFSGKPSSDNDIQLMVYSIWEYIFIKSLFFSVVSYFLLFRNKRRNTGVTCYFQNLLGQVQDKNLVFIRIYSLLGRILKFLYEMNLDTRDLEREIIQVYTRFDSFRTYEQFVKWMTQLCASVCEKMDSSLQNYHNQIYTMALGYIRENFETNTLCLNDIARHANISPAYLSSMFKKVSGQSISDTITALRIESACHYLESTSLSLKEISTKCGYTNQYYFSNSFKKKLGMSPSAYREARGTQGQ